MFKLPRCIIFLFILLCLLNLYVFQDPRSVLQLFVYIFLGDISMLSCFGQAMLSLL